MKDAERIAELEAALRRYELLVEQLQAQLNLRRNKREREERDGLVASAAQSAGVPEGWQLVPVEPTPEMLDEIRLIEAFSRPALAARYAAMLAAAPAQPAAQEPYPHDHPAGVERRNAGSK